MTPKTNMFLVYHCSSVLFRIVVVVQLNRGTIAISAIHFSVMVQTEIVTQAEIMSTSSNA